MAQIKCSLYFIKEIIPVFMRDWVFVYIHFNRIVIEPQYFILVNVFPTYFIFFQVRKQVEV